MIVVMNTNENSQINSCTKLARQYNDTLFSYKSDLSFENENRITFLGHAHTKAFGEKFVNPDDFAEYLIKNELSKSHPVTIDLIGCEIGYCGAGMNEESYAHKLYGILQERGYDNIKVNAFVNFIKNESLTEMKVTTTYDLFNDEFSIAMVGIREQDYRRMQNDPEFIALEKKEIKLNEKLGSDQRRISEENVRLQKNIIAILKDKDLTFTPELSNPIASWHLVRPVPGLPTICSEQMIYQFIKENISKDDRNEKNFMAEFLKVLRDSQVEKNRNMIDTTINELKQIHKQMTRSNSEYRTVFVETDDIRKTFDTNTKYQINSGTYQDVKLPAISQMAIIALSDRSAELRSELDKIKNSRFYMSVYGGDTKIKKIQLIEKTIAEIRSADVSQVPEIIDGVLKNSTLATARTKATLNEIKKDISRESIRPNSFKGNSL